jgi:secreted trypsin-like serine protease
MKIYLIIFAVISTAYSQVPVHDGWRPVASPWEAARFRHVMAQVHPKVYASRVIRTGKIAGGDLAVLGQFPYYAYLSNVDFDGYTYVCGASIVSHNWLLTAAHCLDEIATTTVYVGIIDRVNGPAVWTKDVLPKDFILHEDYAGITNDIALVRLTTSIPSHRYVSNVPLPRRSDVSLVLDGKVGTVCGFGRVNDTHSQPSKLLRYITQDIVANSVCAKIFGSANVKSTNLCLSGSGGRSTCSG